MRTLDIVSENVFKLFVICVFFIYYQTKFFPGSVHSWIMMFGFLLMTPALYARSIRGDSKVSFDVFLVLLLIAIVTLGYVINISTATYSNFQAYIMMLLTYIYVKQNTNSNTLPFINKLVRVFLLINGILIIMQTFTGGYFPAKYLASGDPPLQIASGVSDGPTKNGFLVSFALSIMLANLIFKKLKFSLVDLMIFIIGFVSLILAASRAGLISFGAVLLLGGGFAVFQSLRDRQYKLSISFLALISFFVAGVLFTISYFNLDYSLLYDLRDSEAGNYGLNVMVYKTSNFLDASVAERFDGFSFFHELFVDSPLHLFSVGLGAGSFETLNGLNMHNSWFELLITTGVYGFVIFVVLVSSVVFKALRKKDSIKYVPIIFALLSIMVFMLAHDVLRGRIFWLGLGIISGVTALSNSRSSDGQNGGSC